MDTIAIKAKLHEEIERADDDLVNMLYEVVTDYHDDEPVIDDAQMQLVWQERDRYLRGEGRSYSWEEVKKMARNGQLPDEL